MKRLGEILFGVVLVLLATLHEREQERRNATRMESKMFDGLRSGGHHRTHKHLPLMEGPMKYLKWLWNGLLTMIVVGWLWTITSCTAGAQKYPLVIDSLVDNNADYLHHAIQERAKLEGVFCVIGGLKNDTLYLVAITVAWMDSAGNAAAYSRQYCPERVTIGVLHTHPEFGGCEPSPTDEHTLYHSRYVVAFIACRQAGKIKIRPYWKSSDDPMDHDAPTSSSAPSGEWKVTYRYRRPP